MLLNFDQLFLEMHSNSLTYESVQMNSTQVMTSQFCSSIKKLLNEHYSVVLLFHAVFFHE